MTDATVLFPLYSAAVEQRLKSIYSGRDDLPQKKLLEAISYSLLAGGKRLRPILVCEFTRLSGGDWHKAIPLACAIEMVHTYSLIHDDLPCMDNDDYRRGRFTNHKVFGEAMAVLAGDALLTDAFKEACCAELNNPELTIKALRTLAEAAGSLGMVGGQVLDIMSEDRKCTEQEVLDIQSRKTGCLIQAACVLGTIAGNVDAHKMDAAIRFADNLGLAFQIRDDILDVIGNSAELGKSTGTDTNKNTFVRLYGLDRCEQMVEDYTKKALTALEIFDDSDGLKQLAKSLTSRRS